MPSGSTSCSNLARNVARPLAVVSLGSCVACSLCAANLARSVRSSGVNKAIALPHSDVPTFVGVAWNAVGPVCRLFLTCRPGFRLAKLSERSIS